MQVNGQLMTIDKPKKVNEKFTKRVFILKTDLDTSYPQTVEMEFQNDKCTFLDNFREGDMVTVDFNLRGRQSQGENGMRTFNTLQAWKMKKTEA